VIRESLFTGREVRERGWPSATLRARIERREKRSKTQWRFVIERDFVHRRGRGFTVTAVNA